MREATNEAKAKMKKLLEKGARHMTKITTKAVKAIIHKKWAKFKKLVKDMKKETGKFSRMTLKEAKEFAKKARKNFLHKIDQAKKAILRGLKKVHGMTKKKLKELYGKLAKGKKKPAPAKPEKPNWEEALDEKLAILRAMSDTVAKQKYADELNSDILYMADTHLITSAKSKMLLNKVEEGRSTVVVLFLFFVLSL